MKITFDLIKRTKKITGICGVCGKKMSKTIISEQTVNPFNKNKEGIPKTYHEVEISVSEKLDDWNIFEFSER